MHRLKPVPVHGKPWVRHIVEHVGSDGETYSFEASTVDDENPAVVENLYQAMEKALEGQLKEMGLW